MHRVPRDLPDLCTLLVALVQGTGPGAVQSRMAGVRKCHWGQSTSHGLVNWHVRSRNPTPSVQGAAGSPDLCIQLVGPVWRPGPGNVQSRTACVRKIYLRQSASHGLVNWHVRFRNRKPSVQSAAGSPRLVYTASGTFIGPRSRRCTEPYSGCTNMPFAQECFPWPSELVCVFLKSYI